jgi:hypothetical protein
MPLAALLLDLAFGLEAWQHAIEVVLLDTHLESQLGDSDARFGLDQSNGLSRSDPAALGTSSATTPAFRGRR